MARHAAFGLIGLAAAGCSSDPPAPATPPPILVEIGPYDGAVCETKVDGAVPPASAGLEGLEERLAREDRSRRIRLLADENVPYRCVGGVIFTIQKLGFPSAGFISAPPP